MAEGSVVVLLEHARRSRAQAQRARGLAATTADGLVERLERSAKELEARADELERQVREAARLSERSRSLASDVARLSANIRRAGSMLARISAGMAWPSGDLAVEVLAGLLQRAYREAASARAQMVLDDTRRRGDTRGVIFWTAVIQAIRDHGMPRTDTSH